MNFDILTKRKRLNGARCLTKVLYLFSASMLAFMPGAAFAKVASDQDSPPQQDAPVVDAATEGTQLEEIIVTAQRREERLQKVPISVSVAQPTTLKDTGGTTILALNNVMPSVKIDIGTGPLLTFIRGIGTVTSSAGNEASSALYIDGVYVASPLQDIFSFTDTERVEVLKGPQGTLFGRNSAGGLINIITRTPKEATEIEASVGYGNYQTVDTSLYATTGIADGVAVSVAAFYAKQNDGWGRNITTGKDVGLFRRYGVRVKTLLNPTDTTEITLSADYTNGRSDDLLGNPIRGSDQGNPAYLPAKTYGQTSFYDMQSDYPGFQTAKLYSVSATLRQELSFARLVSITGYRKMNAFFYRDGDDLPIRATDVQFDQRARQFSQELQLQSLTGSDLSWVAGLFYFDAKDGYYPTGLQGSDFGAGTSINLFGVAGVKSYAGFGQATLKITPELRITAGGRYTIDKKDVNGATVVTGIGPDPRFPYRGGPEFFRQDVNGRQTFKKPTWRLALDYDLGENALVYGSYNRGYKAGLFQTIPADGVAIKPETVDAFEIGLKSEFLDRKIRINGALFWNINKNPQVSFVTATSVLLSNAGSARSRGAEIGVEWVASRSLRLRFDGTYLDAKYIKYANVPLTAQNSDLIIGPSGLPTVPGCTTPATGNLDSANGGNVDYCVGNGDGNRLPRASKFAFNSGFDYTTDVSGGEFEFGANLSYRSMFYWTSSNISKQRPYVVLDGHISYTLPGTEYSVRLWGRNLTGTKYYSGAFEEGNYKGFETRPGAPRTYGVTLNLKYK